METGCLKPGSISFHEVLDSMNSNMTRNWQGN